MNKKNVELVKKGNDNEQKNPAASIANYFIKLSSEGHRDHFLTQLKRNRINNHII